MYIIELYNYDPDYVYLEDMMINKNLEFSYAFNQPNSETEFNKIIEDLPFEGYLYSLFKNDKLYASGVFTSDSLYDDIMDN